MQNLKERSEYVIKSKNPFIDNRGAIENYDLVFPVNMANIITSKAGTMRANHYHPEQLQQALVVSGRYISVYKDLLNNGNINSHVIKAGDLVVTPPMVAHTMIFLEDTIFINLVPGNRDHDKFDITHTIKYELVPESEKQRYINQYKR